MIGGEKNGFKDCSDIQTVSLPSTIKSIGSYAFYGCSILSQVTFPDSLEKIGGYAFSETSILKITIPASVNFIGAYAFYGSILSSAKFEETSGWNGLDYTYNYRPHANSGYITKTETYSLADSEKAAKALRTEADYTYFGYSLGAMRYISGTVSLYKNDWYR